MAFYDFFHSRCFQEHFQLKHNFWFLPRFGSPPRVAHQCISKVPSWLKMRDWCNGAASGQHWAGISIFYLNFNRTFCKQTVKTMIRLHRMWCLVLVCAVHQCPTKRMLGLYGLKYMRTWEKNHINLTLCKPETPKWVLWQTVKWIPVKKLLIVRVLQKIFKGFLIYIWRQSWSNYQDCFTTFFLPMF